MKDEYSERFESGQGFRLRKNGVSLLLRMVASGQRLTDLQCAQLAFRSRTLVDSLGGLPVAPALTSFTHLSAGALVDRADAPFYRYVDEVGWSYLQRGSVRLGALSTYRHAENASIADPFEGEATVFLQKKNYQTAVLLASGSNCVVLCGTHERAGAEHSEMKAKFGAVCFVIDNVRAFTEAVMPILGARQVRVHDVSYTDIMTYKAEYPRAKSLSDAFAAVQTPDYIASAFALRRLNADFFDDLYEHALPPAVWSKPVVAYAIERERRIAFELPADAPTQYVTVEAPELARYFRKID